MQVFSTPITFNRFVRGLLFVALAAVAVLTLRWLSPVLVPFLAAWALSWILIPVVHFFQYKCRLRSRTLAVTLTLVLASAVVTGVAMIGLPIMVDTSSQIKDATLRYLQSGMTSIHLPHWMQDQVQALLQKLQIEKWLREGNLLTTVKNTLPHVWDMFLSTFNSMVGIATAAFCVLYLIFLLIDYERFSNGWIDLMPQSWRGFLREFSHDLAYNMRGYFRGQALIALWNCAMFSLGFWLIDLPFAVGLGCFVGIISFVPYIQVIGFLPAALLALLQMAETGRSFWLIMLLVLVVYVVVQIIQDVLILPRIMGNIMGLRPAVILLALSVWGFVGGMVGLMVGLPLTTILIAYYKRYVLGEEATARPTPPTSDN